MKKEKDNREIIDSYDYLTHAASSTDCTGLIPTPASTEAERDAYEAIYPYQPPKTDDKSTKDK